MKPNFFGLNIPHIADFPPAVPLDSYRFWDDGCQRIWINEAEGEFVTTQLDAWVAKLTAAGVKDVIFCLGGTPQWISSQPTNTSCDYGAPGFWGYCAPPRDINPGGAGTDMAALQWYKFIGQYAATHPELLFHWEPWNEFTRQSQSLGTHSWLGTNQQLVRLCEDARAVILGRGKITATGQSVQTVAGAGVFVDGPCDRLELTHILSQQKNFRSVCRFFAGKLDLNGRQWIRGPEPQGDGSEKS